MYGDPVYGEDFFDRDETLSLLQRRMASFRQGDKRNLALVGLRKTGKTSILLEFKRRLTDADGSNFMRRFCIELVLLKNNQQPRWPD